jgi:hypothetical protein
MKDALEELMWDCHRAECDGALEHGFRGDVEDIGENVKEIIDTPEEVNVHNIGVSHGISALLDQLDEAGYTITDHLGRKVSKGKYPKLSMAWKAWFRKGFIPRLSIVK